VIEVYRPEEIKFKNVERSGRKMSHHAEEGQLGIRDPETGGAAVTTKRASFEESAKKINEKISSSLTRQINNFGDTRVSIAISVRKA
jgi:hypothetical protein